MPENDPLSRFDPPARHDIPRYSCSRGWLDNGEPRCIAFGGPEGEARRGDMQAVIESIVTALVSARLASPDDSPEDSASDRTPVVIDAEAAR